MLCQIYSNSLYLEVMCSIVTYSGDCSKVCIILNSYLMRPPDVARPDKVSGADINAICQEVIMLCHYCIT